MPAQAKAPRQRVSAAERRDALIDAAIEEFGMGGLHGTPVDRIARKVGVAQPYVFSLFPSKRDLFIAAVERSFEQACDLFTRAAAEYEPDPENPEYDVLLAIGHAYIEQLTVDRRMLMIQLQAYAACGDEVVREHVRTAYAKLLHHVQQLSGADAERVEDFARYGALINVAAAIDVEAISPECDWVQRELEGSQPDDGAVVSSSTASGTP